MFYVCTFRAAPRERAGRGCDLTSLIWVQGCSRPHPRWVGGRAPAPKCLPHRGPRPAPTACGLICRHMWWDFV